MHDPATPYSGAQHLTAALGHATLLTWTGEGHTAYLQDHACIDDAVDHFLLTGVASASNTTCRG